MSGRDLIADLPPEHNGVRLLRMIQQQHPEYHPALAIAKLAHKPEIEEDLEFRCHATLLKYVEPELRSVQVQAEVRETRTIRVSLFEQLDGPSDDGRKLAEAKSQAPKLPAILDAEVVREPSRPSEDKGP